MDIRIVGTKNAQLFWLEKGHIDVPVGVTINLNAPTTPGNLSYTSTTSSVTLSWSASVSPDPTLYPFLGYKILQDGVQIATGVTALTYTDNVGVVGGTYKYEVVPYNAAGNGYPATINAQVQDVVVAQAPNKPTGLTHFGATATGWTQKWVASVIDATHDAATIYQVFLGNTKVSGDLPATQLSYTVTGKTPGTYGVTVKAVNGVGTATSLVYSVTIGNSTRVMPRMGASLGGTFPPGGINQWDAIRCYNTGAVSSALSLGATRILLTNDNTWGVLAGQSTADALKAWLTTFYANGAHSNIKVHFSNANEMDTPQGVAPSNIPAWANTYKLCLPVINLFPNASLWADFTASSVRDGTSTQFMNAIKQYLTVGGGGMACSFYPPGRKQTPPVYTDYPFYVDPIINFAKLHGMPRLSCWEIGIPVDPADRNHRPYYAAHFAQYCTDKINAAGITPEVLNWWDSGATGTNNTFNSDAANTSPSTAAAWHDWDSYIPVSPYNGVKPASWIGEPTGPTGY